jgi:hypothetical protein
MKVREHNIETNEVIDRDATTEEIAEFEAIAAKAQADAQAKAEAAAARAALLSKLGITEEEARLLLGGN